MAELEPIDSLVVRAQREVVPEDSLPGSSLTGIRAALSLEVPFVSAESSPKVEGMSIRVRLAIWVAGAALLVMALAGFVMMEFIIDSTYEDNRSRASALLQTLAVASARSLAVDEVEQLDDQLTQVSRIGRDEMNVRFVACYDHAGALVTASGGALTDPAEAKFEVTQEFVERALASDQAIWHQYRASDGTLVLELSMPAVSGLRWGTLVASFDLGELERGIQLTRWAIIASAFLVFMVIVAMLTWVLAKVVVRPVKQLAEMAAKVHEGDLSARSVVLGSDELGQLAVDFNAMTATLESYTATLEARVARRTAALRRANAELRRLTRVDPLTGVYNRRHFMERLEAEVNRIARAPLDLCLVILDVDHFKRVNDTYGHQAGDDVLITLTKLVGEHIRATDILARYGGEEFVLMFLDTDRGQGVVAAQKLRELVEAHDFVATDGTAVPGVTVSMGLATCPEDTADIGRLIALADEALYAAKTGGRNRVVAWTEPTLGELDQGSPAAVPNTTGSLAST